VGIRIFLSQSTTSPVRESSDVSVFCELRRYGGGVLPAGVAPFVPEYRGVPVAAIQEHHHGVEDALVEEAYCVVDRPDLDAEDYQVERYQCRVRQDYPQNEATAPAP
jgi:hypothetical protein